MSDFNEANDLASQLVHGRYYQSQEPCPEIDKIVFVMPGNTRGITIKKNDDWVGTANKIEDLLGLGYYPTGWLAKRCKIHNDNRGITFGSDPVHHACGCVVLRGEDVMNENDVELALGQIAIAEGSAIPCPECGDALADNYDCDTCQSNMEEEVKNTR